MFVSLCFDQQQQFFFSFFAVSLECVYIVDVIVVPSSFLKIGFGGIGCRHCIGIPGHFRVMILNDNSQIDYEN